MTQQRIWQSVIQRHTIQSVLAAVLLTAIIWAQPLPGGPRIPSVLLMLGGMVALFKGWLSWRDRRWQQFALIIACLWLPALLSLPDSFAPKKTGELLILLPLYLGFAAAAFYLLDRWVSLARLKQIVTVIGLLWMADGFYQLYAGQDIFGITPSGGRIVGPFALHLRLSLMIAITLPLALAALQRYGWLAQLGYFLAALTIAMLSGVRTDMLTILLAGGLYLITHKKGWRIIIAIPLIVLAGWFASQHSGVANYKLRSFESLPQTYAQWNQLSSYRLDIWLTAWNMFKAHPWNGVGARSFRYAYNEHKTKDNVFDEDHYQAAHAHHPLISIAAETGLPGVLGVCLAGLLLFCWGRQSGDPIWWRNPWLHMLILMVFPFQSMPILFTLWWFPVVSLALIGYLHSLSQQTISTIAQ